MKKFLVIVASFVIGFFVFGWIFDADTVEPVSQVATAYIVSDSLVTIASIKTEDVHRPVYPGGYYQVYIVNYAQLEKSLASEAFDLGIVKPGLDFSIFSGGWGAGPDDMIKKSNVMNNAIYIEKKGTINAVRNLYINDGCVIHYRIVNRILYIEKLAPIEVDELEEDIKKRIEDDEIFIY